MSPMNMSPAGTTAAPEIPVAPWYQKKRQCFSLLARFLTGGPPRPEVEWWLGLIQRMTERGLFGLFHEELEAQAPVRVQEAITPILSRERRRMGARALARQQQLRTLLEAFSASGVEVACLKGAFLAPCVYGDFLARPMEDVDLLVEGGRLEGAEAVFRSLGYREKPVPPGIPEHAFLSPEGLRAELISDLAQSWRFGELVDLPTEEFWSRRRWFEGRGDHILRGSRIPSLDPADHLLYQAFHAGFHHLFYSAFWLVDLDLMVRVFSEELDWAVLVERAEQCGCRRALLAGLRACREVLEPPLQAGVLESLERAGAWEWALRWQLTPEALWATPPSQQYLRFLGLQCLLFESPHLALRALARGLRPPRAYAAGKLQVRGAVAGRLARAVYPLLWLLGRHDRRGARRGS